LAIASDPRENKTVGRKATDVRDLRLDVERREERAKMPASGLPPRRCQRKSVEQREDCRGKPEYLYRPYEKRDDHRSNSR